MPLLFPAIRETIKSKYSVQDFRKDLVAGLIVGVVALPLSMALAIATGVAPQCGLITAIIAGVVTALGGGSRFNISGPTAAFVVILLPIVQRYGYAGLLLSGAMAGIILMAMGFLRLGKYIHLVPFPVVVGFTSGIGTVIAILQLPDFFGLTLQGHQDNTLEKLLSIVQALPSAHWGSLLVGSVTLATMILWPKLKTPLPPHLIALALGTGLAFLLPYLGLSAETLGDRFHFVLEDGTQGRGIPPLIPHLLMPWNLPGPGGKPLVLTWGILNQLIGPAFAIAMLGALESLLCAVVADRMTGKHHHPNGELIGHGLTNLLVPFFGGIPATAAIARTATNVHAGARSPFASVVHSVAVLSAMVLLAPYFAYIPMAVLGALLLMTAWKMSEVHQFKRVLKIAPGEDKLVLVCCFGLTVGFDMVIAVTFGLGLAGLLFLRRLARTAEVHEANNMEMHGLTAPEGVVVYDLNGSLFFGAAQQMLESIRKRMGQNRIVVLECRDVRHIDFSGIMALETSIEEWSKKGVQVILSRAQPSVKVVLDRAQIEKGHPIFFAETIEDAVSLAEKLSLSHER